MSKSIEKIAVILERLLASDRPLGVNEIARYLSLPNSTVSRFIISLEKYGFTRRDPVSRKFLLGMKLFELGCKAKEDLGLVSVAVPQMERLRDKINESVLLMVLEDTHITYIHKVECLQAIVIRHTLGSTAPAYCVSGGRAILAHMPDRLERTIQQGLKAWTSTTLTSPKKLREACEKIRNLGYSTTRGEYREGVSGIAAPVFEATGAVVAAISVALPTIRINRKRQAMIIEAVKDTAAQISRQMGTVLNTH